MASPDAAEDTTMTTAQSGTVEGALDKLFNMMKAMQEDQQRRSNEREVTINQLTQRLQSIEQHSLAHSTTAPTLHRSYPTNPPGATLKTPDEPSAQTPSNDAPVKPQPAALQPARKLSRWPEWDGKRESFKAYVALLQCKIEEDHPFLGSPRLICMNILMSVPEDKRLRLSHWFECGGPGGTFDYVSLVGYMRDQFEDAQAVQSAGQMLHRMRQGEGQAFRDFFLDFELKLAQCEGLDWAPTAKIITLNNAINKRLRAELIPKSLPHNDYAKWVTKVKGVASRLEALPDYSVGKGTKTWYIQHASAAHPPASSSNPQAAKQEDATPDGDTMMTGMNQLVTLIKSLSSKQKGSGGGRDNRPRAPWRSGDELRELVKQKKCLGCKERGHTVYRCKKFRPGVRPTSSTPSTSTGVNAANTEAVEDSGNDSGDDSESSKE